MGCGETCCKVVSGIFTFLFSVGSIGIVAFAGFVTYMILDTLSAETSSKTQAAIPAIVTLVLGLILFCIVFMACCAMCRDSTCCLEAYSVCLILLALSNIGIGIYTLVTFNYDNNDVKEDIRYDVIRSFDMDPKGIDNIQYWVSCCGIYGPNDYKNYTLPESCCDDDRVPCHQKSKSLNAGGCADDTIDFILILNQVLGWACIIVGITQYGYILIILAIGHLGIGIYAVNKYKPVNSFSIDGEKMSFSLDLSPDSTRNVLRTGVESDLRTYEFRDHEKYGRIKEMYSDCTLNCAGDITDFIMGSNLLFGGLDICFAVAEVIGAICAFCLSCSYWRKNSRSDW